MPPEDGTRPWLNSCDGLLGQTVTPDLSGSLQIGGPLCGALSHGTAMVSPRPSICDIKGLGLRGRCVIVKGAGAYSV